MMDVIHEEITLYGPATQTSAHRPSSSSSRLSNNHPVTQLTDKHRRLRMQLTPLLGLETNIARNLFPDTFNAAKTSQLSVRAGSSWKSTLLNTIAPITRSSPSSPTSEAEGFNFTRRNSNARPLTSDGRSKDDPTMILAACMPNIVALWNDPIIRNVLIKHDVRLEAASGL